MFGAVGGDGRRVGTVGTPLPPRRRRSARRREVFSSSLLWETGEVRLKGTGRTQREQKVLIRKTGGSVKNVLHRQVARQVFLLRFTISVL